MSKQKDKNEFLNKLLEVTRAYKEKLNAQEVCRLHIELGVAGAVYAAPTANEGAAYASLCFSEAFLESLTERNEREDKE